MVQSWYLYVERPLDIRRRAHLELTHIPFSRIRDAEFLPLHTLLILLFVSIFVDIGEQTPYYSVHERVKQKLRSWIRVAQSAMFAQAGRRSARLAFQGPFRLKVHITLDFNNCKHRLMQWVTISLILALNRWCIKHFPKLPPSVLLPTWFSLFPSTLVAGSPLSFGLCL